MPHPRRTLSYGAVDTAIAQGGNLPALDEDPDDERSYSLCEPLVDPCAEGEGRRVSFDMMKSTESLRRLMSPPYLLPSADNLAREDALRATVREPQDVAHKPLLSHKQKLTIGMLAFANLASTVVFSCIAPFFPQEAKSKGASETQIGFVFGIFEFVIFLVTPLFGRYITKIGSKFMYGSGLFVTGITSFLFGLLNWAPSGTTFIVLCFVVRTFEAVGDAAFITASFAITAYAFPNRVATVIGLLETFSGLGFTVGPPIGGALYQLGGFQLPFWVLGGLLLIAGLSSFCIIPKQDDKSTGKSHGSVYGLLRYPEILLMVCCIIVTAATLAFLDPTLEPHLSSFKLTPFVVGLMFLLTGGVYTITAPFWGFIIDKKNCGHQVMILGCICGSIALLFIGPSPIFGFEKTLWLIGISQVVLGFGIGAVYIPPFHFCLLSLRKRGYGESFATYGLVSGVFQAAMSFGAFFGPTLGGLAVEYIGFPWSTTILSVMFMFTCLALIISWINQRKKDKQIHIEASNASKKFSVSNESLLPSDK